MLKNLGWLVLSLYKKMPASFIKLNISFLRLIYSDFRKNSITPNHTIVKLGQGWCTEQCLDLCGRDLWFFFSSRQVLCSPDWPHNMWLKTNILPPPPKLLGLPVCNHCALCYKLSFSLSQIQSPLPALELLAVAFVLSLMQLTKCKLLVFCRQHMGLALNSMLGSQQLKHGNQQMYQIQMSVPSVIKSSVSGLQGC